MTFELAPFDQEREDAGRRLLAKMTEVQRLCHGLRSYDGLLEPAVPRIVFQAIYCPPLRCAIHPLENYGVVQRVLHSKDGRYLAVDMGPKPRFWRGSPSGNERKAAGLMREMREIASKHEVWVTLVDESGSFFPQQLLPVAGMLYPAPSEPRTVDFQEYLEQVAEFDKDSIPGFMEADFSPRGVDFATLGRLGDEVEITDDEPVSCTKCAATLVPSSRSAVAGLEKARDCPTCRTVYVRVTPETEMTEAQVEEANRREAVFGEFVRRIEAEFPIPDDVVRGDEITGKEGVDEDEAA